MKVKFSDLWRWDGAVGRGTYLFWGVCLVALKFNLDRLIGAVGFHKSWTIFDWDTFRFYLWQSPAGDAEGKYYLSLLAFSLPFMWSGVVLTLRRLRSLGWRPWWLLLFFVPVLKLFFFGLLCLLPSREKYDQPSIIAENKAGKVAALFPSSTLGSATAAVIITSVTGLLTAWLGTSVLGNYGWALFVGVPFGMGFLSVLLYSYHQRRDFNSCIWTAVVAITLAGAGFLAFAMEGLICIVMAAPLALILGMAGAMVGYLVQETIHTRNQSSRLLCLAILFVPATMGLEKALPPPLPLLRVQSSVIINAPPEKVWENVVSFSELPTPHEMIFKVGVAYPIRAEIQGHGVGAMRHCNFSTGAFVEPIEVWDEPHLLKFSVTQNPEPLQEWTPYHHVHPAHLDGYLQSCGGQFRLVALDGNRTLLEGTTWYHHHLWPAGYWQIWSDYIIHTIHLRVLNHVKKLSEHGVGRGSFTEK